jgi:hypothetical protein
MNNHNTMNIQKMIIGLLATLILCLASGLLYADQSIGEVSGTLHEGATFLAKILWAACIIVGIILFFTAFTQFQIHRTNPKLVPLAVPITYLLLAIGAIIIPFAERIVDAIQGMSVEEEVRGSSSYTNPDQPSSN